MKKKVKHAGSIVYRFIKSFDDYDTTYISPNYYNFTAMGQNTNFFQTYKLMGRDAEGNVQSISTKPAPNVKVGPYFGWRWIFLGYTFDITHPRALGKSSEFNFSLYSSMLGCDFVYIKNSGDFRLRRTEGFEGVENKAFYNYPLRDLTRVLHLLVLIMYSITDTSHILLLIIRVRYNVRVVGRSC